MTILAAMLALVAAQSSATPNPGEACHDAPVRSPALTAYFRATFGPDPQSVPKPTAELEAYAAATKAAKGRDWANLCRYRADNVRLAALPARDRRIVYLGDSITEAWGVADPAFFAGGRINRGISGQTSAQMLLRFQADVVSLHPARVHILAGTNDLAGNEGPERLQDIQDNITTMVILAKANGIAVTLASIPPAKQFPWRPGIAPTPKIAAMNRWLRSYATRTGARYVDYHAPLAAADGGMRPDLTTDGVHLNAAGYARIKTLSISATAH